MAPLALPAFAVVLIWQFTSVWNDFLLGVVVLSDPRKAPVTVALNNLARTYFVEWNIQMAGAVIAALPTVLIYLALGRLFMRGLLARVAQVISHQSTNGTNPARSDWRGTCRGLTGEKAS